MNTLGQRASLEAVFQRLRQYFKAMIIFLDHNPPTVTINPTKANEGTAVTFTCTADTSESATYLWKKDTAEIQISSTFTKTNVTFSDNGTYTCETTVADFSKQSSDGSLKVICKYLLWI